MTERGVVGFERPVFLYVLIDYPERFIRAYTFQDVSRLLLDLQRKLPSRQSMLA